MIYLLLIVVVLLFLITKTNSFLNLKLNNKLQTNNLITKKLNYKNENKNLLNNSSLISVTLSFTILGVTLFKYLL
jgi:uncharacterized membrane protein affecting hemolysin expression